MKKIILITGISGSGKTSLAKYLNQYYEKSVLISMDILKESIYDIVGFSTYEQKQNLKKIVYQTFLQLLQECMDREDETIILEYPFSKRWETSFQSLVEKYQYDAVTIRVKGENFDTIYKRIEERDNSLARHPSHSLANYNPKFKETYRSRNTIDYDKLKSDYEFNTFTSIAVGKIIDFVNVDFDFERIISQIEEC